MECLLQTSWQQILSFGASTDNESAQVLTALRLLGRAWIVILKTQLSHFQSSTEQATTIAWMRKHLVILTLRRPHHWAIQDWLPGLIGEPGAGLHRRYPPTSTSRTYGGYSQGSQAHRELHSSWALLITVCKTPAFQRQLDRNLTAPDALHINGPFDMLPTVNIVHSLSLIQSLPAMDVTFAEEIPNWPLMQLLPMGEHTRTYLWGATADLHMVTLHLRAALFWVRELLIELLIVALVNKSTYEATRKRLEAIGHTLRQWQIEAW